MSGIEFRPDGPHSDDYTREVAARFAESVRVLNHATVPRSGVTCPATVYEVAGSLAAGAYGLRQLLVQLAEFLELELGAGRLGDDSGTDPADFVRMARRQLGRAAGSAKALGADLSMVHNTISGLHTRRGGGGQ